MQVLCRRGLGAEQGKCQSCTIEVDNEAYVAIRAETLTLFYSIFDSKTMSTCANTFTCTYVYVN